MRPPRPNAPTRDSTAYVADRPHITYFDTGFLPNYFGFAIDPRAFAREMKRLRVKEPPPFISSGAAASTHHFYKDDDITSIVTFDPKAPCVRGRTTAQIHAVIAHEAVHVWQENVERMRELHPGREIEAYAIQYFTQCMLRELERKRR